MTVNYVNLLKALLLGYINGILGIWYPEYDSMFKVCLCKEFKSKHMEFYNEENMVRILIAAMTDIQSYGVRVGCQYLRMLLNQA